MEWRQKCEVMHLKEEAETIREEVELDRLREICRTENCCHLSHILLLLGCFFEFLLMNQRFFSHCKH